MVATNDIRPNHAERADARLAYPELVADLKTRTNFRPWGGLSTVTFPCRSWGLRLEHRGTLFLQRCSLDLDLIK